ncbi:MAG: ABC-2 transporter permease [Clostridia bacterium]|nr:ABC-2 transporter permease [Clostridia bacterium]
MFAIYSRELKSYFLTPIGYIFCGMFLVVSGLTFAQCTLLSDSKNLSGISEYFIWLMCIFAVLLPLLTMKLFSDDRRTRTDQILLTSPVSIFGIVMGKYLAALTVFAATFVVNSFNFVLLFKYSTPNAASILMNIFGIFLLGAAFIAIGILLSSLTENQLIAAISAMSVNAAMLLISLIAGNIESTFWRTVLKWFSVMDRFTPFTNQMLDVSAIVYYISLAAIAVFLTTRVIEKRRWA